MITFWNTTSHRGIFQADWINFASVIYTISIGIIWKAIPEKMLLGLNNLEVLTLDGFSGAHFADQFSGLSSLNLMHIYSGLDVIFNNAFASFSEARWQNCHSKLEWHSTAYSQRAFYTLRDWERYISAITRAWDSKVCRMRGEVVKPSIHGYHQTDINADLISRPADCSFDCRLLRVLEFDQDRKIADQ